MVELKNKLSSLREENRKLRQQMHKKKMDSGESEAEQDRSLYNLLQEYMMENQSLRTSNKVLELSLINLILYFRSFDRKLWANQKYQWRTQSPLRSRSWKKVLVRVRSHRNQSAQEWAQSWAIELSLPKFRHKLQFNRGTEVNVKRRKQNNQRRSQRKRATVTYMKKESPRRISIFIALFLP